MKPSLKHGKMPGTDRAKQPTCLVIASHHQVLTVVDLISCRIIDEGIRPSTQMLSPLKNDDGQSARGEVDSGAQTAQTAADDNDIRNWRVHGEWEVRTVNDELDESKTESPGAGVLNFEIANSKSFRLGVPFGYIGESSLGACCAIARSLQRGI
jgi:hypothetical protein